MSTFRKLTRESWQFYTGVAVIVLLLVICDSVYICRDANIEFTAKGAEQQLQERIAEAKLAGTTFQVPEYGVDLTSSIEDKADNAELMGFIITIAGIIIMLIARKFYYMDIRAEEFQRTLPVKERSTAMYDYLCMLGIILMGTLVQGAILITGQTCYNRNMMQLAQEYSVGTMQTDAVALANEYLLIYMVCYLLFVLMLYTWIYLGMTIAKNPIIGAVLSVVNWCGLWELYYYFFEMYSVNEMYVKISAFVESFFSPSDFFYYLELETGTLSSTSVEGSNLNGNSIWINICVMVAALIIGVIFIYVLSGKRELSKGKLFYFPILDYPFAFLCGGLVFFFLNEGVLWYLDGLVASGIGFVAAVVICLWIHPFSKKKSEKWEVK